MKTLTIQGKDYSYFPISAANSARAAEIATLPFSLKILLENLLRHQGQGSIAVAEKDIEAVLQWLEDRRSQHEIAYHPARVLMQDFTGVPAVVDLAAMRDAMVKMGGNPDKINPLCNVDLVIDHSVQVDKFGDAAAFHDNVVIEMQRNQERYEFLNWGQKAFENFRVVPPGTGICHQVNLEYLAKVVWGQDNKEGPTLLYPDTLVGTDSHTTMINGLGVLGWGVGGIEAEAAMLGQPISMLIPEVIGFRMTGILNEGITATDLVLTITQMLRAKGVVGKFVEFYGPGLQYLTLAERATIANMAPEYGATCGLFPVDAETLNYLRLTGRSEETLAIVEAYTKAQGMWHDEDSPEAVFTDIVHLDLASIEPSLAGPKRPQDRVALSDLKQATEKLLELHPSSGPSGHLLPQGEKGLIRVIPTDRMRSDILPGDVVIAAITSCTNTSNPSVLIAAGLLAKKALEQGLQSKPWVKASLAPGSKVVTDYLEKANLMAPLEKLGFFLVGYGCTTCIGNSGPLAPPIEKFITENNTVVSAVLSGNRNFEGRIHPLVKANWLASPPLVVAFALAGTTCINLDSEPLGYNTQGKPVYLKNIWPSNTEIAHEINKINGEMFKKEYAEVFKGDATWQAIDIAKTATYSWRADSSYIKNPPFFADMQAESPNNQSLKNIKKARIIAVFGDSITTDHISPAGDIKVKSTAGAYLISQGINPEDFNSFGARRGNHEVMMRGTFANIRIHNEMLPGTEGGYTKHYPDEESGSIFDIAMRYQKENVPLVIFAGKEYGTGSSRDWAAKGTRLLGIKAVVAESFERIHRSNLIGMGVLPLEFKNGDSSKILNLNGNEIIDIDGLEQGISPAMDLTVTITNPVNQSKKIITVLCRIDTKNEAIYYQNNGILQYVLRNMIKSDELK